MNPRCKRTTQTSDDRSTFRIPKRNPSEPHERLCPLLPGRKDGALCYGTLPPHLLVLPALGGAQGKGRDLRKRAPDREPGAGSGNRGTHECARDRVTGGEPLLCLDRVAQYCKALKDHFGPEHHIHLYTAQAPAKADLEKLKGVVDEIRLHPPRECWDHILDTDFIASAKMAKEQGFDIGIEVPALPGLDLLIPALPYLDFLNINELEWGETNADDMRERGYTLADGVHNAVDGAQEWAAELEKHDKVHWCASSFKDSVPAPGASFAHRGEHRPPIR